MRPLIFCIVGERERTAEEELEQVIRSDMKFMGLTENMVQDRNL